LAGVREHDFNAFRRVPCGSEMYGRERYGTFSIVASDVARGYWGVAVSTNPISVGAVVPWAEWRVGALATQARSNITYGPRGLALLRQGRTAEEVVRRLTRADTKREHRQLAVVDRRGNAAAWTGKKCHDSALHVTGEGFSCQGNILAGPGVVHGMVKAYEAARGSLGSRMLRALEAGQRAGGDRRGVQSAALVVVHREPWFEVEWGDRWSDLRVDQHRQPIRELGRILRVDEETTRKFLRARTARLDRKRKKSTG
jgi:uncharacterized Ntn-hydrolase superfamily protein